MPLVLAGALEASPFGVGATCTGATGGAGGVAGVCAIALPLAAKATAVTIAQKTDGLIEKVLSFHASMINDPSIGGKLKQLCATRAAPVRGMQEEEL